MFGKLEMSDGGGPRIRFERTFPHPVEKVWRAITEPEQLAQWFPTTIEGERTAGAPLRFDFPQGQAPGFDGEMLAFDPPRLMEMRWGPDTLRLELHPDGGATRLFLTDTLELLGKAARDGAGWHTCLDALTAHLDGRPESRDSMERWGEVHPTYVAEFGSAAATIGPPDGM